MQPPQLRTPLARAVVPVGAGIVFFGVLGLVLWGIAASMSSGGHPVQLGSPRFEVGRIDKVADSIRANGPQIYPDLKDASGKRSIVVDHSGNLDAEGWHVYRPVPADKPGADCFAQQRPKTRVFVDCTGRELDATALQPATDVTVIIESKVVLALQFDAAVAG